MTLRQENPERLYVFIGSSPGSGTLIRDSCRLAQSLSMPWTVIYIEIFAGLHNSENRHTLAMDHLRLAERLGADTDTLSRLDFIHEVIQYCRSHHATQIALGLSMLPPRGIRIFGDPVKRLTQGNPGIKIHILSELPKPSSLTGPSAAASSGWKSYAFALLILLGCTIMAEACANILSPTNILMIYLVGILVVVSVAGKGPSTLTCILGVLSFDYCIITPRHAFAPTDVQYIITLVVALILTLTISGLINRAKTQAEIIRARETQARLLFELTRELLSVQDLESLFQTSAEKISDIFNCPAAVLVFGKDGALTRHGAAQVTEPEEGWNADIARWVQENGLVAGRDFYRFPEASSLYLPIRDSTGTLGVLAIQPEPEQSLNAERKNLLQALVGQIGASAENIRLSENSREAWKQAEVEKLRSSLLSSVSHDLHIPLSVIKGSASSLLDPSDGLNDDGRRQLLQGIYNESARLERYLRNLLEMTKLGAGASSTKREEQILEDLVGSVLNRLRPDLKDRQIVTHLPETLSMVLVDGLLVEQLLANLLENALKYTPPGSPIEISAAQDGDYVRVDVSDHGPGLEADSQERVFEKFYRGKRDAQRSGAGLGLAICRGVVEAHGGRIWAENRPEGGAQFSFTLPSATTSPHSMTGEAPHV